MENTRNEMTPLNHRLNIKPNKKELGIIKQWLYEEYLSFNSREGFYCNWALIEEGVRDNYVFTYLVDEIPVGLVLWGEYKSVVSIDILVIAPSKRRLGFGHAFVNALYGYFQQREAFAIRLFCEPEKSVSFWEGKMGFIKYPNRGYSESELTYYKPLVFTTAPSNNLEATTFKLELWDVEPYLATRTPPKWSWSIDKLHLSTNPIIQPCNCNWNLRLTKNGSIIEDDKIKYFGTNPGSLMRGEFLYISNLDFSNIGKVIV